MPCLYPLKAYRSRERAATGGYGITFNATRALIESAGGHLEFPCNKCIGCRVDRSRAWAVRCMHEAQMHQDNCFLTLTYDDKHLPDDYSVDLAEYKNFLKRLRVSLAPKQIRFFGCAEYGEENHRPHYHFLIFNHRPTDLQLHSHNKKIPLHTSQSIQKLWKLGFSTVGELNYQTAAYCARYVIKKIGGDLASHHYTRQHPITGLLHQVRPEFSTQSRRPGLGDSWLQKYKDDVFPSDFVVVDGKKHPVPKFYTRRLAEEEQHMLKRRRSVTAKQFKSDNTLARRRVREIVLEAKITSLKRNLK